MGSRPGRRPLVVFDLDGTLVDSRRDLADGTNEMLTAYGARSLPVERVAAMVGEGVRVLVRRALAAAGLDGIDEDDAIARFGESYDRRLLRHTRLYDGMTEALRRCSERAVLAVLTNKPEAPSRRLVDGLGLAPLIEWIIGGDSPFGRKPDPAGLQELVARAGVPPAAALLVGDSRIDVETGARAGVAVCAARYGFGALGPDELERVAWTIDAPVDLPGVLDRWFAQQSFRKALDLA